MKITTTVQFHNEAEFLPGWFKSAFGYSDEIICGSHNATDGSLEYVKQMQKDAPIPIKILEFPPDTVHEHGFSYIKNALIDQATGDWIVSLDADEEMEMTKENLQVFASHGKGISTKTMHISSAEPHWTLDNREQVKTEANWKQQRHWRIFKNGIGIRWYGLIHESLYIQDMHICYISRSSNIKMYHFGALAVKEKRAFKDGLYAELLLRAAERPELRRGTDKWWFDVYVRENNDKLQADRAAYRARRSA